MHYSWKKREEEGEVGRSSPRKEYTRVNSGNRTGKEGWDERAVSSSSSAAYTCRFANEPFVSTRRVIRRAAEGSRGFN